MRFDAYPIPDRWIPVLKEPCPVQKRFIQAGWRVPYLIERRFTSPTPSAAIRPVSMRVRCQRQAPLGRTSNRRGARSPRVCDRHFEQCVDERRDISKEYSRDARISLDSNDPYIGAFAPSFDKNLIDVVEDRARMIAIALIGKGMVDDLGAWTRASSPSGKGVRILRAEAP